MLSGKKKSGGNKTRKKLTDFFFFKDFTCKNPKIYTPVFLSILPKGQGQLHPLPTKAAVYQSSHAGFESIGRGLKNIYSFARFWLLFLSKEPWEKHH